MRNFTDVYSDAGGESARLAICTLLTLGDAYLPGVMALAWSLRENVLDRVPAARRHVRLACMVTRDVPESSLRCIATAYDDVIIVPALGVSPTRIAHRDPGTRVRYSRLLTKLRVFGLSRYAKVLFLDADILALQPDLLNLFTLRAPAAVFYGCAHPTKDPQNLYNRRVCPAVAHGMVAPASLVAERCGGKTRHRTFMKFETSLFLAEPSLQQMERVLHAVRDPSFKPAAHSDTGVFNGLFASEARVINANFLGRWQRVAPDMVTLDSYGFEYKPWDDVESVYPDVIYWRKVFHRHVLAEASRNEHVASHPVIRAAWRVAQREVLDFSSSRSPGVASQRSRSSSASIQTNQGVGGEFRAQ